jgi:hypothetical protein
MQVATLVYFNAAKIVAMVSIPWINATGRRIVRESHGASVNRFKQFVDSSVHRPAAAR